MSEKPIRDMTDAELAEARRRGQPDLAREDRRAERRRGRRDRDPGTALKGVGARSKVGTRIFSPADERRHRAVLDAPPRSPQAERVRAVADRLTQAGHIGDRHR